MAVVATLVLVGLGVFLRRYRGADRTAMALAMLVGAGLCLILGLAWFQRRFGGATMTRRRLREIGLRAGAIAGLGTNGVGVGLLAVRWAFDQQAGPTGDRFLPAFLRALSVLGSELVAGLPAFLAMGAVIGSLVGLGIAEAIGFSGQRDPEASPRRDA